MSEINSFLLQLLAAIIFTISAHAAENQTLVSKKAESQLLEVRLNAQLTGVQYFSESTADSNFHEQAQVEGVFEKKTGLLVKAHGLVGTFSLPKSSYFAVPELYVGVRSQAGENSLSVGRKLNSFSHLDQQQNLGLFNATFTNDFIRYQEQGLIGFHGEAKSGMLGVYAGFYPLYIPNQGPQIYEEDGEIRSSNRWAQKPPSQFRFGSQNREIVYAIRDYNINEIVKNSGEGASVFIGESSLRPWMKASYVRKPVNQIPLARDTYGTASNFVGQVKLSPVVTYGQVQSVDLNFDRERLKTTFSYLEDRVFNTIAPENETLQNLMPLKMYGAWISYDMSDYFKRTVTAEISYAELYDGEIKDLLADGRPSVFTFSGQRSLFKRPLGLKLNTEFFLAQAPLNASLKWTYDRAYRGTLFSGSASYQAMAQFRVNAGFDLLGVEVETTEEHFLQDKQANDRIHGGLEYVF